MQHISSLLEKKITGTGLTGTNSLPTEQYSCPHCRDKGVILKGDVAYICPCTKQKRLERSFKTSRITPAFRYKTFEHFDVKFSPVAEKMFSVAWDYVKNFTKLQERENNWLAFLGQPGCGKTHLIMAIANHLLEMGYSVLYFQHVEGFTELRDALRESGDGGAAAKIAEVKKAPVLLWDDLFKGREMPTAWVLETVFEIVNYRYLNCLPTLFSSERLPKELLEIDEAIASRILERAKGRTVIVKEKAANYRLGGMQ